MIFETFEGFGEYLRERGLSEAHISQTIDYFRKRDSELSEITGREIKGRGIRFLESIEELEMRLRKLGGEIGFNPEGLISHEKSHYDEIIRRGLGDKITGFFLYRCFVPLTPILNKSVISTGLVFEKKGVEEEDLIRILLSPRDPSEEDYSQARERGGDEE